MVAASARLIVDTRNAIAGSARARLQARRAGARPMHAARRRPRATNSAWRRRAMIAGRSGSAVALVAYVYVGYPAAAARRGRGSRPPSVRQRRGASRHPQPGVSIVIAARNEGARLAGAHRQPAAASTTPPARRQIIVVSDGSTDDTLDVLAAVSPASSTSSRVPAGGKALALNAGVGARAHRHPRLCRRAPGVRARRAARARRAVRRSAGRRGDRRAAARLRVGACPTGSDRDRRIGAAARERARTPRRPSAARSRSPARRCARRSPTASACTGSYEKQLRRLESRVGSTLGATGAIYAMRRSLWQPLPADTILDDVLAPMRVVLAGYRVVFNEQRARLRPRRDRRGRRSAAQGPHARRQLPDPRARAARCCCRGATRCGCSTCRTSSDGWWCPTRCSRSFAASIVLAPRTAARLLRGGARRPGAVLPARRLPALARVRRAA